MTASSESITLMPLIGGNWTFPPSPVPRILAEAGVPDDVWSATCNAVLDHQARFAKIMNDFRTTIRMAALSWIIVFLVMLLGSSDSDNVWWVIGLVCLPPAVAYGVVYLRGVFGVKGSKEDQTKHILAWSRFVEEEKGVYRNFGIECHMVKETARKKLIVGGVKFSAIIVTAATTTHVPPAARSIASELESLRDLHRSGALTEEEFSLAKARVLSNEPTPTHNAQAVNGDEPTLAFAQIVPDLETTQEVVETTENDQKQSLLELV